MGKTLIKCHTDGRKMSGIPRGRGEWWGGVEGEGAGKGRKGGRKKVKGKERGTPGQRRGSRQKDVKNVWKMMRRKEVKEKDDKDETGGEGKMEDERLECEGSIKLAC